GPLDDSDTGGRHDWTTDSADPGRRGGRPRAPRRIERRRAGAGARVGAPRGGRTSPRGAAPGAQPHAGPADPGPVDPVHLVHERPAALPADAAGAGRPGRRPARLALGRRLGPAGEDRRPAEPAAPEPGPGHGPGAGAPDPRPAREGGAGPDGAPAAPQPDAAARRPDPALTARDA